MDIVKWHAMHWQTIKLVANRSTFNYSHSINQSVVQHLPETGQIRQILPESEHCLYSALSVTTAEVLDELVATVAIVQRVTLNGALSASETALLKKEEHDH